MADTIFFEGFRVEHFAGWDNTGDPIYGAVTSGDSNEINGLGYINLYSASSLPNTLRGCLWGEFKNVAQQNIPLNDFWICFETRSNTFRYNYTGSNRFDYTVNWDYNGYNSGTMKNVHVWPFHLFLLHGASGSLSMRPTPGTYGFSLYLQTDLVDLTTATKLDIPTWIGSHDSLPHRHSIQVSGAGTANGTVSWYVDGVLQGTCTTDLSAYRDFHAISFHADSGSVQNSNGELTRSQTHVFYAFVTNFRTVHSYLDYRQMTDVSNSTWVGDTTKLEVYPTQFNTLGGLYSTASQQVYTAVFGKSFSAQSIYYPKFLRTVLSSSSYLTEYGTVMQLSATNASSQTVAYGKRTVDSERDVNIWESTVNPFTQKNWTIDDINATSFNFSRTVGTADVGRT